MNGTLVDLLRCSVERFPDKIAIVQGDVECSYKSLWNKACGLANYFVENGLQQGDRVSILIENSVEYIVAYYATLLAGGGAIGLNTAAKSRDLTNWITHSRSSFLVARVSHPEFEDIVAQLDGAQINILPVGEYDIGTRALSYDNILPLEQAPEGAMEFDSTKQLASIIYTSGTTGHPKGVMLSHDNLFQNTSSVLKYLKLDEHDSIINVLPFYYSYGNSVLHTHLAVGATLVLENSMLYPQKIVSLMEERKVSGFSGVPSTFSLLLNRTRLENFNLGHLRYMTQAGGAMAPVNIDRIKKLLPNVHFFVMYGQTEASSRLSYLPPDLLESKLDSIGIAIPGVELEVMDKNNQPVGPNNSGEIYARGGNVMLGYWQDETMTNQVKCGEWLKTGDLAYKDDEGFLYIVGRSSEMIKSGGHRISPKDIEEVVLNFDGVEEAAVVGIKDELLDQVIKLFIVKSPTSEIDKRKLMRHCKENLANYKIPKHIEFIDEIPRTASGKVRRFLLQD
jgi:long-chain acyl-CoA synthetase